MQRSTVFLALAVFSLSAASMRADQLSTLAADDFAVLGAATTTNTGNTVLNGNLGVFAGTSISGFPPGIVNLPWGIVTHPVAAQGQIDATAAHVDLAGLPVTQTLTGQDLGGQTLTPGVYYYSSGAQLTGQLTLNFEDLNNQNIVFQIESLLNTASASSVIIEGAGTNDNVYWEVDTATLDTTTAFVGNIIAQTSISLANGATINCGSAIALTGAVTMIDNTISTCGTGSSGGTGGTGGGVVNTTPEPGTFGLLATGILGVAGAIRRRLSA
jgi:type VI secretion system secreted protein VgrG